ncbi:MAG: hypothetical protein ACKO96_00570, partial [Flammeovirgaceae bacterium]
NGTGSAIQGQTATGFTAVYGRREGATNGNAGLFEVTDAGNTFPALQSKTVGTGSAANFNIDNATNAFPALFSQTNGTGAAGGFFRTGTSGFAPAVSGKNQGPGQGGYFEKTAGSGNGSAIEALNYGDVDGAAAFGILNANNPLNAIFAQTTGTGTVAYFTHNGASGNIVEFRSNFSGGARIDKTGKGFFNGGTQTGGADVAEMFDVEGPKSQYEPGDVLVISETNDRTVEKSSAPASTK